MNNYIKISCILFVLTATYGCKSKQKVSGLSDKPLAGRWNVSEYGGEMIPVMTDGKSAYFDFDPNLNRVYVSFGCNGMRGSYRLEADTIYFDPNFMSTKMYCEELVKFEDNFSLEMLGKPISYSLDGDKLTLTESKGKTLIMHK